jgi:hypothetical protein
MPNAGVRPGSGVLRRALAEHYRAGKTGWLPCWAGQIGIGIEKVPGSTSKASGVKVELWLSWMIQAFPSGAV